MNNERFFLYFLKTKTKWRTKKIRHNADVPMGENQFCFVQYQLKVQLWHWELKFEENAFHLLCNVLVIHQYLTSQMKFFFTFNFFSSIHHLGKMKQVGEIEKLEFNEMLIIKRATATNIKLKFNVKLTVRNNSDLTNLRLNIDLYPVSSKNAKLDRNVAVTAGDWSPYE